MRKISMSLDFSSMLEDNTVKMAWAIVEFTIPMGPTSPVTMSIKKAPPDGEPIVYKFPYRKDLYHITRQLLTNTDQMGTAGATLYDAETGIKFWVQDIEDLNQYLGDDISIDDMDADLSDESDVFILSYDEEAQNHIYLARYHLELLATALFED